MPGYLNAKRIKAARGKFADEFTMCLGCEGDLWDVLGTGVHPDDTCERLAASKARKAAA
jgi:hypothetical protein